MKKCLYCNTEFTEIQKRKVFCSSKCRSYASRVKNRVLTKDWEYVMDKNGIKFPLDKSLVLKLAIFYGLDVRVPKTQNKPKIDTEIKHKVSMPTISSFELPQKMKVDYKKEYELCEFPDEYKALWDKINADDEVCTKDKKIWKITLNIK
jgi:hypothetical protein